MKRVAIMSLTGIQPSTFNGGLDDLESFQAWAHEIKAYLAQLEPALFDVLDRQLPLRNQSKRTA